MHDQLQGTVLESQYKIGEALDQGAFGEIYICHDLENKQRQLVVKIGVECKVMKNEIKCLKVIKENEN